MYLYNKNLYIFVNKMECGYIYFKYVYRKCVVCNILEKMNIKIGLLIIYVNILLNIVLSQQNYIEDIVFYIWINKFNKILQYFYKSFNFL